MKTIALGDFLDDSELKAAALIWRKDRSRFHRRILDEILLPNMQRINSRLGQENSPDYLAYAMEYAFMSEGL